MNSSQFNIVAFLPFWRYAVSTGKPFNLGEPFYTHAAAKQLFDEAKRELPNSPVFLLKRTSLLGQNVAIIEEYDPATLK